jgi:hypothetical protein
MTFKVDDWVRHGSFGDGQIYEDRGDRYVIQFVSAGEKLMLKTAIETPGAPPHEGFSFRKSKTNSKPRFKVEPPARKPAIPFDHLVDGFLRTFDGGFEGESFQKNERGYKEEAIATLHKALSAEQVQALLSEGKCDEVASRSRTVMKVTNLVFPQEKIQFNNSLKNPDNQALFAKQLNFLLHSDAPEEERFSSFVDMLGTIAAAKWTTATYFQFLWTKGDSMFMKPKVAQKMADSLGFALNYKPEPNWLTYSKLQELSGKVKDELQRRGQVPRSGIDIQGFIWSSFQIEEGKYGRAET